VIVVGFEGAVGRGSVRGPAGARLFDALSAVQESLVRFGGHQAAAGVEVEYSKLEELRQRFEAACAEGAAAASGAVGGSDTEVIELLPEDDPRQVLSDVLRLEPCGEGNPRPEFAFSARLISARAVKGGHLKLELEAPTGCRVGAFAPNRGELAESLGDRVRVIGELRPDRWRGGDAVEVSVRSVEPLRG
jgi:single-stranded-DNA-specific exonuclease